MILMTWKEESKLKQSVRMKLKWKNADWRKKISDFTKSQWSNPEHRKTVIEKNKIAKKLNPTKYWKGKERPNMKGVNNWNWKGGISEKNKILRQSVQGRNWIREVFKRDNYTCQSCGDNSGGNLEAHHIKTWAQYPLERFNVSNGITLCETCHKLEHKKRIW